jgi:MoaA/NifB/PqqE/SkfB family radical SAM enzyme
MRPNELPLTITDLTELRAGGLEGRTKIVLQQVLKISDRKLGICPVGLGEPLLYPKIYDVLRLLRKRFPKAGIHINTSALLLDEDLQRSLLKLELMTKD